MVIVAHREETNLLILLLWHIPKGGYDNFYLSLLNVLYQFMYLVWCLTVTAIHIISRGDHFLYKVISNGKFLSYFSKSFIKNSDGIIIADAGEKILYLFYRGSIENSPNGLR